MVAINGAQNSRGVMILGRRNLDWKLTQTLRDDNGRILALNLDLQGVLYSLVTVYAPTQDKPGLQMETINKIDDFLRNLSVPNIILGGDLNCFMDPTLDKNTPNPPPHLAGTVRARLLSLMDEWGLTDIWRVRNECNPGFTFRRGSYSSRLDYLLISSHLSESVKNMEIDTIVHSDHAILSISISPSQERRGPGFWKLDPSLLESTKFTDEMRKYLTG